jgi:hypothetical protein
MSIRPSLIPQATCHLVLVDRYSLIRRSHIRGQVVLLTDCSLVYHHDLLVSFASLMRCAELVVHCDVTAVSQRDEIIDSHAPF